MNKLMLYRNMLAAWTVLHDDGKHHEEESALACAMDHVWLYLSKEEVDIVNNDISDAQIAKNEQGCRTRQLQILTKLIYLTERPSDIYSGDLVRKGSRGNVYQVWKVANDIELISLERITTPLRTVLADVGLFVEGLELLAYADVFSSLMRDDCDKSVIACNNLRHLKAELETREWHDRIRAHLAAVKREQDHAIAFPKLKPATQQDRDGLFFTLSVFERLHKCLHSPLGTLTNHEHTHVDDSGHVYWVAVEAVTPEQNAVLDDIYRSGLWDSLKPHGFMRRTLPDAHVCFFACAARILAASKEKESFFLNQALTTRIEAVKKDLRKCHLRNTVAWDVISHGVAMRWAKNSNACPFCLGTNIALSVRNVTEIDHRSCSDCKMHWRGAGKVYEIETEHDPKVYTNVRDFLEVHALDRTPNLDGITL